MSSFAMMRNMYQPKTSRDLLLDLGVGQYNATMLVETMMMAPATTESAAAATMLLVGYIQQNLNEMGAGLEPNGYLDSPTVSAISQLSGRNFMQKSWFDVGKDVMSAQRAGLRLQKRTARPNRKPVATGAFDLPDVPGGLFTYAAGGLLLWHFLSKKKRTAS